MEINDKKLKLPQYEGAQENALGSLLNQYLQTLRRPSGSALSVRSTYCSYLFCVFRWFKVSSRYTKTSNILRNRITL